MGLINDFKESISDWRALRNAKRLRQMSFQGGSGGQGYGYGTGLPFFWTTGSKIDFAQEIGDLRLSSLVQGAVRWVGTNVNSARPRVVSIDKEGKEEEQQGHPLAELLANPNPYYSGATLLQGFALSWIIGQVAYAIKVRSGAGLVKELWFEPNGSIRPRWPMNGSEFIEYYEILRNGVWRSIESEDVLMLPDGIDPYTRLGQPSVPSLLRELYTDQQASQFSAQLLRHGLVPPVIISVGDDKLPMTPDVFKVFKQDAERKFSGDDAGKPFFVNGPAEVSRLGFEYDKVGMKEIRQTPEERFCSVIGISPISLMLGAGKDMSTLANVEQFQKNDYRGYIVPLHTRWAREMTRSLLPDFGDAAGLKVNWDYSEAALMQPDKNAEHERIREDFKARILDQVEAREAMDYKAKPEHDGVYYPVPSSSITISPIEQPEPQPTPAPFGQPAVDAQGKPVKPPKPEPQMKRKVVVAEFDLDEGADWWKASAPPNAQDLIDATVKPNGKAN